MLFFAKFEEELQSALVLLALVAMMSSNIDRVLAEVKLFIQKFANIFLEELLECTTIKDHSTLD